MRNEISVDPCGIVFYCSRVAKKIFRRESSRWGERPRESLPQHNDGSRGRSPQRQTEAIPLRIRNFGHIVGDTIPSPVSGWRLFSGSHSVRNGGGVGTMIFLRLVIVCSFVSGYSCYGNDVAENAFVSNHGTIAMVYNASPEVLKKAILAQGKDLWRVEVDNKTGQALADRLTDKKSNFKSIREAEALMKLEKMEFFWMPPAFPRKKVSEGGNIKPLRSPIRVTFGTLKTNEASTFVSLTRTLEQRATLHIPFTEIPSGRGRVTDYGCYHSDLLWLRGLLGTNQPLREFFVDLDCDTNVIRTLQELSEKPINSETRGKPYHEEKK